MTRALLTFAVEKGHSKAQEYMVGLKLLDSLQLNPLVMDQDEVQVLEQIDAIPYKQ